MKNKKYEKILAVVLMVFMVLWTIGTIFAFENKFKAKADSVVSYYRFEGSNVLLPVGRFNTNAFNGSSTYDTWFFSSQSFGVQNIKFIFDSGRFETYAWHLKFTSGTSMTDYNGYLTFPSSESLGACINFINPLNHIYTPNNSNYWTTNATAFYTYNVPTTYTPFSDNNGLRLDPTGITQWSLLKSSIVSGGYTMDIFLGFNCSTSFSGKVVKIKFGAIPIEISSTVVALCNYIQYIDETNYTATFYSPQAFGVLDSTYDMREWEHILEFYQDYNNTEFSSSYFAFYSERTYCTQYYVDSMQSATYNDGYEYGYNIGRTEGLNNNQANIYQSGYDEGFELGRIEGRNVGYQQGVDDAGNYTFLSLLGAVVDAPITALSGLLNFTILDNNGVGGVNLLSFFYALMTLALIIFVVRLMLGGGK